MLSSTVKQLLLLLLLLLGHTTMLLVLLGVVVNGGMMSKAVLPLAAVSAALEAAVAIGSAQVVPAVAEDSPLLGDAVVVLLAGVVHPGKVKGWC